MHAPKRGLHDDAFIASWSAECFELRRFQSMIHRDSTLLLCTSYGFCSHPGWRTFEEKKCFTAKFV